MTKKLIPLLVFGLSALVIALALTGGVSKAERAADSARGNASRWQIHKVDYFYGDESKVAKNTVLLDSVTGDTWLLMASEKDDEQYYWLKIPKK